jgi:hypothetical protein
MYPPSRLVRRIDRRLGRWLTRRTVARASRLAQSDVQWTCSRGMTWVATLSDQFLGMVEEVDGSYVANDTVGGTYNTYRTRAEAMQAFEPRGNPRPALASDRFGLRPLRGH